MKTLMRRCGDCNSSPTRYAVRAGVWHDGGSSPCKVTPSIPTMLSRLANSQQEPAAGRARTPEVQPGQVVKKPEVIDDFLRNFFIKMGLSRTCEIFEAEWYELKATGRLDSGQTVPDVYLRNAVRPGGDGVAGTREGLG